VGLKQKKFLFALFQTNQMVNQLEIIEINGAQYSVDLRLSELRSVAEPWLAARFSDRSELEGYLRNVRREIEVG
jgi:hypothetical protein